MEITCDIIRAENLTIVACDDQCQAKKKTAEEEKKLEIARKQELEAEKNKRELEIYEKKFGKKAYKEFRKQKIVEEEKDNSTLIISLVSVSVVIVAVALYFTVFN